jgi:hypothetical protein
VVAQEKKTAGTTNKPDKKDTHTHTHIDERWIHTHTHTLTNGENGRKDIEGRKEGY